MKLFTPQEVADILQIDRQTVYGYIYSGRLKATKVGGLWKIKEETLDSLLNGEMQD